MTPSICVAGSFMMDLVVTAARRPAPGETVVGTGFDTYLGGKGFNQAVAAARAGAQVSVFGRLGDDEFGAEFRKAMRTEGIDDSGVAADPALGTGVGLPVVEPNGQNSIIIVPRANTAISVSDVDAAQDLITAADVLLLQLELPVAVVRRASDIARAAGTLVILNPAPYADTAAELAGCVDIAVPNEIELVAMADGVADVEAAARRVTETWAADVVATLGERGSLVVSRGGAAEHIAAHRVDAVDTIGAGDTYCAYLAAAVAGGDSLAHAARRANTAAALAVTRRGGADSAPYRGEVDDVIDGVPAHAEKGRAS